MTYIIQDKYHKLILKLVTKLQLGLTNSISIKAYKKNVNTPVTLNPLIPYPSADDDGNRTFTFELRNKDYNVGDEFVRFVAVLNGEYPLTKLNEGVSILIDGAESNVLLAEEKDGVDSLVTKSDGTPISIFTRRVTSDKFAIRFEDTNPHTIQAIYKGNSEIGVAVSDKVYVTPKQDSNETYLLTSKIPSTLKYMELPNWEWRLTKGGSPVSGATIETVNPTHTWTKETNADGKVSQTTTPLDTLAKWTVGTYKIRGEFWRYEEGEQDQLLCRTEDTVKIIKNTPTLRFTPSSGLNGYMFFKLLDPQNRVLVNKKIVINVNGKTTTKITNKNGNVSLLTNNRGNLKGKATYAGDKNYNSVSVTFNQTIR